MVGGLWVRDMRRNPGVSYAILIPLLWLLIIGSRFPSEWLRGSAVVASGVTLVDGSPLDRNVFLGLLVAGIAVVVRRVVERRSLETRSWAIGFFFLFALISVLWSDYPLVAIKRWQKVLGHVVMAMVVLTERDPAKAVVSLLRRAGILLLAYSVLYLKYYPHLGRGFDTWTGAAVNFGVTTNKNALGALCFIWAPFFVVSLLAKPNGLRFRVLDDYINLAFLAITCWLLLRAESSTALVSTLIAIGAIGAFRVGSVRRQFSALLLLSVVLVLVLLASTDIKDLFLASLGEDSTLTSRTELWEDLQGIPINPLVGTGFESFWLGERLVPLWAKWWWQPNQAHNGYYETYLNLGLVGLFSLSWMVVSVYRNARRQMLVAPSNDPGLELKRTLAEYTVAFILGLLGFNMTDATFKALHPTFFLFFLMSLTVAAGKGAAPTTWRVPSSLMRPTRTLRARPVRPDVSAWPAVPRGADPGRWVLRPARGSAGQRSR